MRKYRKLFALVFFFSFVSIFILLFYAGNEFDNPSTNVNKKKDLEDDRIEREVEKLKLQLKRNKEFIDQLTNELNSFDKNHVAHQPNEGSQVVQTEPSPQDAKPPGLAGLAGLLLKRAFSKNAPDPSSYLSIPCQSQPPIPERNSKQFINIPEVVDQLPFDNPDGGGWKQGWDVKYSESSWNSSNQLHVFLVPHSHQDPGWVKTFEQYYVEQVTAIFRTMIKKLNEHRDFRFIYAEISFLARYWDEVDEETRALLRRAIESGQMEIATGGWVMTDEASATFAAMLDNLVEGHDWLLRHFNESAMGRTLLESSWSCDPFGYGPSHTYLVRKAGMQQLVIQRVHYALKKHLARQRALEFRWRQFFDADGHTGLLTHMMPFYSYDIPHTCGPEPAVCCQFDFVRQTGSRYSCPWGRPAQEIGASNTAERAATLVDQYKKKAQLFRTSRLLVLLGDDFRYDSDEEAHKQYDNYRRLFDYINSHPTLHVKAKFSTLAEYFRSIRYDQQLDKYLQPAQFPALAGDFFTYADRDDHYWSGYFTTRPHQKLLGALLHARLRAAELLYALVVAAHLQQRPLAAASAEQVGSLGAPLTNARRTVALFLHHDTITGTSKDYVVVDMGKRLMEAFKDAHTTISSAATALLLKSNGRSNLPSDLRVTHYFDIDDSVQNSYQDLPTKVAVRFTDMKPREMVIVNSLLLNRSHVVRLRVEAVPHLRVLDANTREDVHFQLIPVLVESDGAPTISSDFFDLVFEAHVSPLGLAHYVLIPLSSAGNSNQHFEHVSSVELFNGGGLTQKSDSVTRFKVTAHSADDDQSQEFALENSAYTLTFSAELGHLKKIKHKASKAEVEAKMQFIAYGSNTGSCRSGAYMFLPDGEAHVQSRNTPPVLVVRGALVSEAHVSYETERPSAHVGGPRSYAHLIRHQVVRLYDNAAERDALEVENLIDVRAGNNVELGLRIATSIASGDTFYTDQNCFQMQRRRTHEKLHIQGNIYPLTCAAYIEDSKVRLTLLTQQPLGFSSLKSGLMDIMLDRRLNQDDGYGLTQAVLDQVPTRSIFKLLLETFPSSKTPLAVPALSLAGQLFSEQHRYPPLVLHAREHTAEQFTKEASPEKALGASLFEPSFEPSGPANPPPCDVQLLNARVMLPDAPAASVNNASLALFVHRVRYECAFAASAALLSSCSLPSSRSSGVDSASASLSVKDFFGTLLRPHARVTHMSLTLLKPLESTAALETPLKVAPNEIEAYKVHL